MSCIPQEIVSFWRDAGPGLWFRKSDDFDREIEERFSTCVTKAKEGALDQWLNDATSCLALIILLDQFPRNMFRGTPEMFESDTKARQAARHAVESGHDKDIEEGLRAFIYMPFMHSEDPVDQETSVRLFERLGRPENIKHAIEHAEIIEQFSRFPHRNAILGRASSPQELEFLENGGFAG